MSTALTVSVYVLWVLFLIVAVALLALYRYFGQMYVNSRGGREEQGPEIGSSLLSIARQDLAGRELILPGTRPTLIFFADTACVVCSHLRDHLDALDQFASQIDLVVFCSGRPADVQAWAARVPSFARVVADVRSAAAHHYAVNGTPYVITTAANGIVTEKGIINSRGDLVKAAEETLSPSLVPNSRVIEVHSK